jgi:hypothetical protein
MKSIMVISEEREIKTELGEGDENKLHYTLSVSRSRLRISALTGMCRGRNDKS